MFLKPLASNLNKLHTGPEETELIDSINKMLDEYEEARDVVHYQGGH